MPEWTCSDRIRQGSQTARNRGDCLELSLTTFTLVALPGRSTTALAQQLATVARQTLSGCWAQRMFWKQE
jgi:hypothetical protein